MAVGKPQRNNSARYAALRGSKPIGDKASWEEADADLLWRVVTAVTEAGDAITLGKTRDGGAVSLTVLSGEERIRLYAHGEDEVAEMLASVMRSLENTD